MFDDTEKDHIAAAAAAEGLTVQAWLSKTITEQLDQECMLLRQGDSEHACWHREARH